MALVRVDFQAPALAKACGMNLIVPDVPGPWPVLYLLHGLGDDHTIWGRRTSLERYLAGTNLMVVMPDGQKSFYANDPRPGGLTWEDHIISDVVGFCDRVFPTRPEAPGRAIAGLSMGGYGAMMLGLKHRDKFSAISSHSGALGFLEKELFEGAGPMVRALDEVLSRQEYNCHRLAEQALADVGAIPAVRFDCGVEDFLIAENRAFHSHLTALGLEHEYTEHPGMHNWAYWDAHIQETLAFIQGPLGVVSA